MQVTTSMETMTLAQQEALLATSPGNRSLCKNKLARYKAAMLRGGWLINGEALIVDEYGRIMDGHHRLTASIALGDTRTFLVTRGVPRAAFPTINTGRPRTAADVLCASGVVNSVRAAAIARFLIVWRRGSGLGGASGLVENSEVQDFVEGHDLAAAAAMGRFKVLKGFGGGIIGGFYFLFAKIDEQAAAEFMHGVDLGANLADTDARFRLREMLMRDVRHGLRRRQETLRGLMYKTWVKWRAGDRTLLLKWSDGEQIGHIAGLPDEWQFGFDRM